jgi:hypothetical protein
MPLSQQHRPALAAILVAIIAVLSAFAAIRPASAAPASDSESNPIVDRAMQDLDTYQGECWLWMKAVVLDATGVDIGFDYRWGFLDRGAVEVSILEAGPGDVIQIADDDYTDPEASYDGLHTAIILSNNGDGTFEAIDSNQNYDGVVHLRSGYDPAAAASRYGLNFHIYRIKGGDASLVPPPVKTVAGPLFTGDKARVNTPGDCLRVRSGPAGTITHCLGHGTQVTVTGAAQVLEGIRWVPVTTMAGSGWMAESFLLKEVPESSPAAPSGTGTVKPAFQYRAFVNVATD